MPRGEANAEDIHDGIFEFFDRVVGGDPSLMVLRVRANCARLGQAGD
jgi:hypothetical protein